MLVKTYGSAVQGIDATPITIEVNVGRGAKYYLVGLPDNAVKESQQRVEAAIKNSGFRMPRKKIVINMAPADIRKEGSAYDLPIAMGILAATQQINETHLPNFLMMGELSLDGSLQPIKGALPIAIQARDEGFDGLILPEQNSREAAIVNKLDVYGMSHISAVIEFFNENENIQPVNVSTREEFFNQQHQTKIDFSDVKGQVNVKRAMEVAAAGGHNVIMIGPPGSGKTMIAQRLPTVLPPLTLHEALETTKIHSVIGNLDPHTSLMANRPFRSPHHIISDVALVGGGTVPKPGEISLAHNGVLFLDELPEFQRSVLEVLRQPMEDHKVTISRARFTVEYPANFMLVASMNPCPCGYYNHPDKECVCSPSAVQKYMSKISGPLLDRIDIHIEVTPVPFESLSKDRDAESSETIRNRVVQARTRQEKRFQNKDNLWNAQMSTKEVRKTCTIDQAGENLVKKAMEQLGLSARAYDRILKVSRTIADLNGKSEIAAEHLAEAIQYRSLDRDDWAE